jgi:hypothetical protein
MTRLPFVRSLSVTHGTIPASSPPGCDGRGRLALPRRASLSAHIPVKNMMCAFGVPGNMIHGTPGAGFSESPVDAAVAPGM